MPARRELLARPRCYLLSRGKWPRGPFRRTVPDEFLFYLEVVKRLAQLCEHEKAKSGRTVSEIARDANLTPQTVFNILNGRSWGELPTIYRLEVELNAPLWQNPHIEYR